MVDTGASPAEDWQADSGKTDKGPVVLTVLVVLALVASIAMLFTNSPVVMKLATLAALWAAFLGVFLSARYRRSWAHEKSRAAEAKLAHAAELTHEQELHREQELLMEQNYADALREQQDRVLSQITNELEQMRQTLESLTGREWVYEPADVHVEARRRAELASTGAVDAEQPEADHSAEKSPVSASKPTAVPTSAPTGSQATGPEQDASTPPSGASYPAPPTKSEQDTPTSETSRADDIEHKDVCKETTPADSSSQDTPHPETPSAAPTAKTPTTAPVRTSHPKDDSARPDTKDGSAKEESSKPQQPTASSTEEDGHRGRHGARGEHEKPRQAEKNPTHPGKDASRGKASTPGRHEPHSTESMTASGSRVTTSSFAAVNWEQGGTRTAHDDPSKTSDAPDASSSGRRHREASTEQEEGKLTVAQLLARNKAASGRDDAPRGRRRAEDRPRGRHSSKDTNKNS